MTRMEMHREILTELQEIAPILGKGGITPLPYRVPKEYFNDFAEILMIRIRLDVADRSDEVVSGQEGIVSPLQEISEISPLLAGLQGKNPYHAPSGYFEKLTLNLLQSEPVLMPVADFNHKKNSGSQGKLISFVSGKVFRYGIAACVVALLGIFLLNRTREGNPIDPISSLTSVSAQDMANFLDADDFHWTPGVSPSETASVDFSEGDIHALFSNVSDEELEQYLPSSENKATPN